MADLVTDLEVQQQLRLTDQQLADQADEIQRLMDQATAIVLAYCGTTETWRTVIEDWVDEDTTPQVVRSCILQQVQYLYSKPGDKPAQEAGDGFAPGIRMVLGMYRDPVIA